ncbi:hypothetical protein HKK55_28090 [Pseudomonas sp. ADAK18]|uniref:hypothetical protein n=1 Tax=Pseudomonas sp. ADAK18 TaxID=2730848 RepID=UPI0014646AAD|nr:hypothetical protein [Pseudomonas sp. ADAK18]QJI32396.1 hypothetical protein HKK55_28090 [Pseudomonas sp. ADAK18]
MFSVGNAFLANFSAWINPRDMDSPGHDSSARVDRGGGGNSDPFDLPDDDGPGGVLHSMFPNANIDASAGLSARDLRAGKFDPLPLHIAKDLESLPKDQNYSLRSYLGVSGEEELVWEPEDPSGKTYDVGDPPFVTEALKRVTLELGGIESASVTASRNLKALFPNVHVDPEEGISTDDLRAGKFGSLPLQVAKDLECLPKNETYYLKHLVNMGAEGFSLGWEPESDRLPTQTLGEPRIGAEVKRLRSQAATIMPDGVSSLRVRQFI